MKLRPKKRLPILPAGKIELWPISSLKPSQTNTRLHTKADVLAVKASIERWGIVDALHTQISRGNTTAMIFFEKCRGGKRETIMEETSVVEVVSAQFQNVVDSIARRFPTYEEGPILYTGPVITGPFEAHVSVADREYIASDAVDKVGGTPPSGPRG